jgi:hypothetical protein
MPTSTCRRRGALECRLPGNRTARPNRRVETLIGIRFKPSRQVVPVNVVEIAV